MIKMSSSEMSAKLEAQDNAWSSKFSEIDGYDVLLGCIRTTVWQLLKTDQHVWQTKPEKSFIKFSNNLN